MICLEVEDNWCKTNAQTEEKGEPELIVLKDDFFKALKDGLAHIDVIVGYYLEWSEKTN